MYEQKDHVCGHTGSMTRNGAYVNEIMTKRRETLGANIVVPVGPPDLGAFPAICQSSRATPRPGTRSSVTL